MRFDRYWSSKWPKPRTTDTQRELFFKNLELLGLGRHFGWNFLGIWGIFGRTISTHFGTVFFIIQPLFLQKTKLLYPTPKYLLGAGFEFGLQIILIFSLLVSVVRDQNHYFCLVQKPKPKMAGPFAKTKFQREKSS